MEPAVLRRLCRVVAEQVVSARVADDLLHPLAQVIPVDDGAAVGVFGQHLQRRHGLPERVLALARPDVVLDVELAGRQPARVDGIDGRVGPVSRVEHRLQFALQVELGHRAGPLLVDVVFASQRIAPGVVPQAGEPGHRVAHLRGQHGRVALADQHNGLASLAQRPELDGQALQRRQRHLPPNPLDNFCRLLRILVFDGIARLVAELPALELLDRANHALVIARQHHRIQRCQRIHHRHQVVRRQLGPDEVGNLAPRGHGVAHPHVVIVEEEHEDARRFVGRGVLLILAGPDGARGVLGRRGVDPNQSEGLDRLRLAVLEDLEVFFRQAIDGIALPVGGDDVHSDEVDTCTEDRLLDGGAACGRRRGLSPGAAGRLSALGCG